MTGDRVQEDPERWEVIGGWLVESYGPDECDPIAKVEDLLAENARLRAQLDTVRGVADNAPPLRGFGGEFPGVVSVTDIRAALNQGGETK